MDITDVIRIMKERQGEKSVIEFSREIKCSPAYLYDIYKSNRSPGKKILSYLGIKKRRSVEVKYVLNRR